MSGVSVEESMCCTTGEVDHWTNVWLRLSALSGWQHEHEAVAWTEWISRFWWVMITKETFSYCSRLCSSEAARLHVEDIDWKEIKRDYKWIDHVLPSICRWNSSSNTIWLESRVSPRSWGTALRRIFRWKRSYSLKSRRRRFEVFRHWREE